MILIAIKVALILYAGWALFCVVPARCCPTPPHSKTEIWASLTIVGWLYFTLGFLFMGVYVWLIGEACR